MADLKISQLTGATTPLAGTEVLPIVQNSATKKVAVSDLTAGRAVSAATIATSGNAAVATSLVAWNASYSALDIGGVVGLTSSVNTDVWYNAYVNAGGTVVFKNGGFPAARIRLDGALKWATTGTTTGTAGGTATLVDTFEIDTSGNIKAVTGNFVQGTAAKGVNFTANTPAAGMTSQLLNWYEEGTWTGTLGGQTTDPTTPVTATGLYTRIGRQVTVQIYFVNVDTTGGSGNMEIRGLPFTPKGTTNDHYIGSCESYGLDVPNKYNVAFVAGSVTKILFQSMADDAAWTEPQLTAGATKFLAVTLTYFV